MRIKPGRFLTFLLITVAVLTAPLVFSLPAEASPYLPTLKVAVTEMETITTERILSEALSRMGYQTTMSAFTPGGAAGEVDRGEADLMAPQFGGQEMNFPNLIRVPESFGNVQFRAYARNDLNRSIDSWDKLAGLRLAKLENSTYVTPHAEPYVSSQVSADSYEDVWNLMAENQADVAVIQLSADCKLSLPEGLKEVGMVEEKEGFLYVNKKQEALIPALTTAIQEMKRDGTLDNIRQGILQNQKDTVLYLSSYHSGMKWEANVQAGIVDVLGSTEDYDLYKFNLDARRMDNFDAKVAGIRENIRVLLVEKQVDAVVVSDDDAMDFVVSNYYQLFEGVPVIFCGVNGYDPGKLQGISQYFGGCVESISVRETVEEMLRMYPETEKIYILNDYSNSGRVWKAEIEKQLSQFTVPAEIEYNANMTKEELAEWLKTLSGDTLVLLGTYMTDAAGSFYEESVVIQEFSQILEIPIFIMVDSYIGTGALGGCVASSTVQGETAGAMLRQILDGKTIAEIGIITDSEALNRWMFDEEQLVRFRIDANRLPAGSILVNQKVTIWDTWPAEMRIVVFIILLLAMVILALCIILGRNRTARLECEERSRENSLKPLEDHPAFEQKAAEIIGIIAGRAPLAFFTVLDGRLVQVNDYARNEIGMEEGANVADFYKTTAVYERALHILERQEVLRGDITYFSLRNGDSHKFSVNYSWMELGGRRKIMVYAEDIEEAELQKNNLIRSQNDLKIILDALPTAIGIIEAVETSLEYANDAFRNIFGFIPEILEARLDMPQLIERFYACWQGSTVVFDYENDYLKSQDIHLKINAAQIIFLGKPCIALIVQDVTAEFKQARYLEEAANKEKEANALKSIFLANMSHEIRTPMNAIIGLSQLALMKEQNGENYDFFSKISSSAKNLLTIINDILDFSKIEAEKMDFVEDEFILEETITNAFLVVTDRVEDKPVEILLNMHPEVPCSLIGDKTRLWQVLRNILDNSVKYTSAGRIILSISPAGVTEEKIILDFGIKDTGAGMTNEQVDRMFVPFEQFHRNNSKKAGTGLGMSITKRLIDMMGGSIKVESAVGIGSQFTVTIPFKRAEDKKTMREFMQETVENRYNDMGAVLLVDDDSDSLRFMASILMAANIYSVPASNAAGALELVRTSVEQGTPFPVVLIDYVLGEDDGLELARELRAISPASKLLLVTAYARKILSDEMIRAAGIEDIIEKPYVISTFLQKTCSVLPEVKRAQLPQIGSYPDARVLLCEDNEINQLVVTGVLENFDVVPVIAENGAEAIERLEEEHFDLVLMDIMMPVMDGHEATLAIRRSDKDYRDVPIIAMTANVMADEVAKCFAEGMNGHLEKPIDIDKFQAVLAAYLTKS